MRLKEELRAKKEASAKSIPKEKLKVMLEHTEKLKKQNISNKALKLGDVIKDFTLPNSLGNQIRLYDLLEKTKVILTFYRGGWCPYCNMELRAYQKLIQKFNNSGATLVAITPETPDNSLSTTEKNNLEFQVLSDVGNKVGKEMGLVFTMPKDLREVYHSFGLDVSKHNDNQDYELPMPATYIVTKNGRIEFAFVPEDYTDRVEPKEILEALLDSK